MLGFYFISNGGRQLCHEGVGFWEEVEKNKGKIHFDELNEDLLIKTSS